MEGVDGRVVEALAHHQVVELMQRHGH
jgi:hypothetical protein